MRHIVSNALAFQNCEAPGAAAPEAKARGTDKGYAAEDEGFAQKLKDFEDESSAKLKPQDESGAKDKDTGMCDNPECMVYGIVGILEGFEPPGYQTDKEAVITAGTAMVSAAEGGLNKAAGEGYVAAAAPQADDKSTLPEQIAWTLNSDEAGERPVKTQEQVLQIVGDYLDSLENTNKAAKGALPENEAAELSNSKVMTNKPSAQSGAAAEEKPAETAQYTGLKNAIAASTKAGAPGTETAEAASTKAGAPGTETADKEQGPVKEAPETVVTDLRNTATVKTDAPESVKAAAVEQTYEEAKPQSVRESVIRIVDKVSTKAAEGKYDFDIDLKPDFMGKVSIKLTMEDGAVKVQIKADDPGVKGMLSDQTSSLQNMLKEKGINVSNIDVMHHGNEAPGSEGQQRQDSGRRQEGSFYYEQADNGTYESARERYDFYLGDSSIEYLA